MHHPADRLVNIFGILFSTDQPIIRSSFTMKTSFLSLFAFAGIFACALAAPTRDPGAAVKVAVEERDVNIGLVSIINTGYVNIQKTNAVISEFGNFFSNRGG